MKSWVTRGIRQSMKIRDKLYKQFIKSKNNQTREIKQAAFRKYRNKITDLLQISRQTHYQKYFSDNTKNTKALWQGIHEIIYSKKAGETNNPSSLLINQKFATNQQDMTENFNNFFTSIGKNLQETIPPTREDYAQYLKTPSTSNFSIKPIKPEEIRDIIKTPKNSKSAGPNSIPTKILKIIKKSISTPLSTLINNSFANGTFPKVCKRTPVFKNKSRLLCNNYRPISLLSNVLQKY